MKNYLQRYSQEIVGIVSINSIDFVETVFNTLNRGAIAVPLRDVADVDRIRSAGVQRTLYPGARTGWARLALTAATGDSEDSERIAQIVFTSGTTGEPKGIVISMANLVNTSQRLNDIMQLDDSVREYIGIPVYYSFGLGRCRAVSAAGGEFYIPPNGFDIAEIADLLRAGRINALSAVPSQWRLVLENSDVFSGLGEAVKWIEIGSQFMSGEEKQRLADLFPAARIVQHYGLTEASRTTFLRIGPDASGALESVGRAEAPVEVRVNDQGVIQVRGPHVATRQLVNGELVPLVDRDGWLTTGDLGRLSASRELFFLGRADHVINCAGIKIAPEAIEGELFAALGCTEGLAVSRLPDRLRGDGVLVVFTPDTGLAVDAVKAAAVAALAGVGITAGAALTVRPVANIPRTATGKIRRGELPDLPAADTPSTAVVDSAATGAGVATDSDLEAALVRLWEEALGVAPVSVQHSFFDLGGDSLTAIALMLKMERAGVDKNIARQMMKGLTIAEIVARMAPQPSQADTEPPAETSTAPVTPLQAQLIALWQEALGVTDVGIHDSYFDLGGDSLTAIALMLKMEKAGVSRDIARNMMSGLTIAELCQQMAQPAQAGHADDSASNNRDLQRVTAIWQQALGVDELKPEDSFYDLGGDSLTAVGVALKMEQAGIDREVARGIFRGASIAELARSLNGGATAADAGARAQPQVPRSPVTSGLSAIAELNEASNFLRGLVILCILSSHWLVHFLKNGGSLLQSLSHLMAPLFSLGSPTLAVIFGFSISVFYSRQYRNNRTAFRRSVKNGVVMLLVGVLIYGLAEIIPRMIVHRTPGIAESIYLLDGPLIYFAAIMASVPIWMILLHDRRWSPNLLLGLALLAWFAHVALTRVLPESTDNFLYQLLINVLVGKWGLFKMGAGSILGIVLGMAMNQRLDQPAGVTTLLPLGVLLFFAGIVLSISGHEFYLWWVFPKSIYLWSFISYAGVAVMVVCSFRYWYPRVIGHPLSRWLFHVVCCFGVLLFPIFVMQSVVWPTATVLAVTTSWTLLPVLAICVAVFMTLLVYPLRKVYRLYYG